MRLRALVSHIEGRFPGLEGLAMNLCQTGDSYVTVGTPRGGRPGVIEPGALAERFLTEPSACAAALAAFDTYAEGRDGALYWRAPPEMDRAAGGYRVRMRLVISESPVRWRSVQDFIEQEIRRPAACTPR